MLNFLLFVLATLWMALVAGRNASEAGSIGVLTPLPLWASSSQTGLPAMSNPSNRVPPTKDETSGVTISTDKQRYYMDEPIWVTIENARRDTIYVPVGLDICSIVVVEQRQNTSWKPAGMCPDGMQFSPVVLRPGSRLTAQLGAGQGTYTVEDGVGGEPAAPSVYERSLHDLPPAASWKPGDPVIEVPQGISTRLPWPPFSLVENPLEPGIYRLEFRFIVSDRASPQVTVYSQEFLVTG
jgi:hypothetical protein